MALRHSQIQGVAVLTNGSLFWDEAVRRRVQGADIIMPTLSSAFDQTFKRIHRPHPELDLGTIIEGLKSLRKEYHGQLLLEAVFHPGSMILKKRLRR